MGASEHVKQASVMDSWGSGASGVTARADPARPMFSGVTVVS